jgi:hypothetical protein
MGQREGLRALAISLCGGIVPHLPGYGKYNVWTIFMGFDIEEETTVSGFS